MNLQDIVTASIAEFLDVEVHRDTTDLNLASKIEIAYKRVEDRAKKSPFSKSDDLISRNNDYEYEMYFSSNPNDMIKIDGWIPIETKKIEKADRISEYIEIGLLRKIESN